MGEVWPAGRGQASPLHFYPSHIKVDRALWGRPYILLHLLGYNIAWSPGKVISGQPFAGRGKLVEGMPEGYKGTLYSEFLPVSKFSGYILEPVPHKGRQCDGA